jgi:DNA-damage-inducible protein J
MIASKGGAHMPIQTVDEGGLPPGLTATPEQYDQWFKAKVYEALNDPGPGIPLEEAMKRLESTEKRAKPNR